MSLADIISPEVPYLRRYARALTGSQESGDAYVLATIEAIVSDPALFSTELAPRVSLYRTFLKIWSSLDVNDRADNDNDSDAEQRAAVGARRTLQSITPRPRQALLLTSLEGFSATEAAAALDVSDVELQSLIDQASQEIAEQVRTRVLIIEDEPLIAAEIKSLVLSVGHEVTGIARTRDQAVQAAKKIRPGLILADIQLADGSSGIDAVNDLLRSFEFPVIFITSYPDRLLTGERPEPTFLITKPFEDETVKAVISQALFFDQSARSGAA
ncbi:MAG: response regulator [Alphaproteobacteria bacterium]|nr:response regulator [Alphaproteobacteria bacterium]